MKIHLVLKLGAIYNLGVFWVCLLLDYVFISYQNSLNIINGCTFPSPNICAQVMCRFVGLIETEIRLSIAPLIQQPKFFDGYKQTKMIAESKRVLCCLEKDGLIGEFEKGSKWKRRCNKELTDKDWKVRVIKMIVVSQGQCLQEI